MGLIAAQVHPYLDVVPSVGR